MTKKQISPAIKRIANDKHIKDVLDLGCGEGDDLLYLLENNKIVTGIDISEEKIKKLKNKIKKNKDSTIINKNIKDFEFNKTFDAIIMKTILHFIPKQEIKILIEKCKDNTSQNGINYLSAFTPKIKLINGNATYLEAQEIKEMYSDWKIIIDKEIITPQHKDFENDILHSHSVYIAIFQKDK